MAFEPFTKDDRPTMANFNKKLKKLWDGSAKVELVSHQGTGSSGKDGATSLSFSFAPKMIWLYAVKTDTGGRGSVRSGPNDTTNTNIMLVDELTTTYVERSGFTPSGYAMYVKKSDDGKTIYWYSTYGANQQVNTAGWNYYYCAIG